MKPSATKKKYLRFAEGVDPLLPVLSLMLLLLPILIGHVSFSNLRVAEVEVPPGRGTASAGAGEKNGALFFFVRLGAGAHLTNLVEEDTGRNLSSLQLPSDGTAPSLVKTEFRRLQRKYAGLDTVWVQSRPDVSYESFIGIIASLQAPVPDSVPPYLPPRLVVIPSGGL